MEDLRAKFGSDEAIKAAADKLVSTYGANKAASMAAKKLGISSSQVIGGYKNFLAGMGGGKTNLAPTGTAGTSTPVVSTPTTNVNTPPVMENRATGMTAEARTRREDRLNQWYS
jgi:hypothetical protein